MNQGSPIFQGPILNALGQQTGLSVSGQSFRVFDSNGVATPYIVQPTGRITDRLGEPTGWEISRGMQLQTSAGHGGAMPYRPSLLDG